MTDNHATAEDGITRQLFVGFRDLERQIDEGKIIDALTPAVFCKVQLRLASLAVKKN